MKRSQVRSAVIGLTLAGVAVVTASAIASRPMSEGELNALEAGASLLGARGAAHWDLPVKRTDRVTYWEGILTGARRAKMKLWLEQSGRYVPMIRQELRARGMPEDLVYLALIESGFSPNAYSSAKAVGLWQLMAGTGRELGLKVSDYVDQRRDPVAATDAALDFLQDLHRQFGSWWLAAAAYNCGPNRVARVLREVTGKSTGDDDTYWRIAAHLPQETQDYVPLMLAAGTIAKDPARFGFTDLQYHDPLAYESVRVPGGTRLVTVSKATGADSSAVDQLNPHYVRNVTPPGNQWIVRIPEGLHQAFAANFPHLLAEQLAADARGRAQADEAQAQANAAASRHRASGRQHAPRHRASARRSASRRHARR